MVRTSSRHTRLLSLLFVFVGLIVVGIGIWIFVKSIRAEYWPVTDGIVRSAEMKSHSSRHGRASYSAEVTYDYQVAGKSYTGDKVAIGQMSASSEYARGILKRYPVGKRVSVHYSTGDPSDAVLEPGIHGGTWICLGVGTLFTLLGIMHLQIDRAVLRAQMPGASPPSSIAMLPDGRVAMSQPPVVMGVIFLLAGIGLCFVPLDAGRPGWLMYVIGAMFFCGGTMLLLYRLENKAYYNMALVATLLAFLVVFHWISFGAGERSGTASTPFSVTHLANVRTPFAIFTIMLDLVIVAGLIRSLLDWRKDR